MFAESWGYAKTKEMRYRELGICVGNNILLLSTLITRMHQPTTFTHGEAGILRYDHGLYFMVQLR
jgi:hypothetical protein